MNGILRWMFFALIVRPLILVIIGLNVRHRERLPQQGPAIIAANHNSHLDTLVLMSLVPLRLLPQIRTVGAADYFMRNRLLAWFATAIIGIIPVNRMQPVFHPLADAFASLDEGRIVIMYPEGTRGEPEVMRTLKRGIGHIAQNYAAVPVIPVFMHGLGKAGIEVRITNDDADAGAHLGDELAVFPNLLAHQAFAVRLNEGCQAPQ